MSGTVFLGFGPTLELENALLANVAMKDVCLREHVKAIVDKELSQSSIPGL
jgi:hypothetical protein